MRRSVKANIWRRVNANRNRYAAAPVRDALELQAIRALNEAKAAKKAADKHNKAA
jgi:hypothetical protein